MTTATSTDQGSFSSLPEIKAEHRKLIKAAANGSSQEVKTFLQRSVAAGRFLDCADERLQAQGLIDYWASMSAEEVRKAGNRNARSFSERPSFQETLLAPFAAESLAEVAAALEKWASQLRSTEGQLARRVMLRLVRLPSDSESFEIMPVSRAALYDLGGSSQKVDEMVERLATLGAVRVVANETREADQITLRSLDLERCWPTFATWLEARRAFRRRVQEWDDAGQSDKHLLKGDDLWEARCYADRNEPERAFTEQSRYRELRQAETNKILMWIFLAVAIGVAITLATNLFQLWQTRAALADTERARVGTELSASSQSISTLAIASLLISEDPRAVHSAKKLLIIQSLRQLLFAPDRASKSVAESSWRSLEHQLTQEDPEHAAWFKSFLQTTYKAEIARISASTKPDRATIADLDKITLDLKKYIVEEKTRKVLDRMRPSVMAEAVRITKRLTEAAQNGEQLSTVEPFELGFWRLSSGLLILFDERIEEDFAHALRTWEDAGGTPNPTIAAELKRGLERLEHAAETANSAAVAPTDVPKPVPKY